MSSSDEISAAVTVGSDFSIYIGNSNKVVDFRKNAKFEVEEGSVSFPCFSGENLYLTLTEHDEFSDDKDTKALSCENLELGSTRVEIEVGENSGGIGTVAGIMNSIFGTSITFSNP
eukprot:CAMPEP_0176359444 /NCGR_PEP_ID=MMETSP0126-20121128/16379_1 /TAXON_ID=141414 ORGANISM="Strombidinopsis acuminatum, Strain SPMC142" /NCGR_SAMPLE_ID=MMETSP0126 /ASSEMBLY_ACC=CAM_ASM_000229 /LENGTH=115 /DNA_ID=CAMNT_0017714257 /DNA_START=125 /DNA_END=472 /DNA_ORIENTATION=-